MRDVPNQVGFDQKQQLNNEVWLSLVERYVRDVEAAGSNPVTSTIEKETVFDRLFSMIEGRA